MNPKDWVDPRDEGSTRLNVAKWNLRRARAMQSFTETKISVALEEMLAAQEEYDRMNMP